MAELGRHGVLDAELADELRRADGFRNVLVHEYVTVDDAVVPHRLSDLTSLHEFVRAVVVWVGQPRTGGL